MAQDTINRKRSVPCKVLPFRIVETPPREDVINALRTLLAGAIHGQVTGLAFVAVLKGRDQAFISDFHGTCSENLTHTRGALRHLDGKLDYALLESYAQERR